MAFNLEMYPISYIARYNQQTKNWQEEWIEADTYPYNELLAMEENQRQKIYANRNQLGIPAVSYTSQYGYGCFEGMKAYPRKDGKISIGYEDYGVSQFGGGDFEKTYYLDEENSEKFVSELQKLYPTARILRMDNDTTGGKEGHYKILKTFADKKADILVLCTRMSQIKKPCHPESVENKDVNP